MGISRFRCRSISSVFLAVVVSAGGFCLSCSGSGNDPVPLTQEEQHKLYLGRVTELLRTGNSRCEAAMLSLAAKDTITIPGKSWPYEFPNLSVTARGSDSIRTTLVANHGDNSNWMGATEEFLYWGDSSGFHPPSETHPLDRMAYVLNHSKSTLEPGDRTSWDDRFSFTIEGLSREAYRIGFAQRAEFTRRKVCSFVPCEEYEVYAMGRFVKDEVNLLGTPVLFPARLYGRISDYAGPDSTGRPATMDWEFEGDLLADYVVILESTSGEFTATDTISIALPVEYGP